MLAPAWLAHGDDGGARRDRTADLYNAIVALSQLSYGPVRSSGGRVDKGHAGVKNERFPMVYQFDSRQVRAPGNISLTAMTKVEPGRYPFSNEARA